MIALQPAYRCGEATLALCGNSHRPCTPHPHLAGGLTAEVRLKKWEAGTLVRLEFGRSPQEERYAVANVEGARLVSTDSPSEDTVRLTFELGPESLAPTVGSKQRASRSGSNTARTLSPSRSKGSHIHLLGS